MPHTTPHSPSTRLHLSQLSRDLWSTRRAEILAARRTARDVLPPMTPSQHSLYSKLRRFLPREEALQEVFSHIRRVITEEKERIVKCP